MAIPSQSEMYFVVLSLYGKGGEHTRKQMKDMVTSALELDASDREVLTGSGVPIYESRTGWAISNLAAAGYLKKSPEGHSYHIAPSGREALAASDPGAVIKQTIYRRVYANRRKDAPRKADHQNGVSEPSKHDEQKRPLNKAEAIQEEQMSPIELIDEGERNLHEQLSRELMERIMQAEGKEGDAFFERLVTKLLVNMGYGVGRVTAFSNDGGIDGIITTDALGFDPVCIQAKRYSENNPAQAPAVQQFAGALGSVTRGVFITTSRFTSGARQVANTFPHATIRLIDGTELTKLMIEYDLGVATDRIVKIKRLDSDFFPEV